MKIKLDGDLLSSAIKTARSIVQVQLISLKVSKGFLAIIGVGNGNSIKLTVPVHVVEKSEHSAFSVGADIILSAVEKRGELVIDISDSSVVVNSKRYQAELLIQPYEKVVVVPDEVKEDKGGIKLKDSFLNAIREQLPKMELKPLLAMYDYIPFGVKSTKKGTFIACFDFFQSAFYFDPELKGDVEFTLPSSLFSTLAKQFKGQNYKMSITDTTVYAFNENFELSIARPQTDGQQLTLDNMITLYEDLKANKIKTKLKLKKEGILALIENVKAVYEKDSTFTFKTSGDKCQLELKSSYGKVKGLVMLEEAPAKDVEFSCDFNFFSTLLAKAPATVELRVNDKLMLFGNKPVTYLLSLV